MKKQVNKKRVFVGLSGGVDSSVAAYLLKKQGYDVVGVHLRCWNREGCDVPEAKYARRVAGHLGIPFYIFNLEQEYKKAVVDYMIDGYKKGITPNPDVMCNKEIKFGLFLKKALEMGADYVATGHYTRLRREFLISNSEFRNNKIKSNLDIKSLKIDSKFKINNSKFNLWQAKDSNKDQSYFLWTLTQDQLKHSLFPLGDYLKSDVRKIAKEVGLPNADKKDSQGICFIGDVDVKEFLAEYIPKKKGDVVDTNGKVIGKHDGIQFYTIGQRHGLGIGGAPKPYYISSKNKKTNTLVVSHEDNDKDLSKKEVTLRNVNFINSEHSNILQNVGMLEVLARVRYRQTLFPATLFRINGQRSVSVKSASVRVLFDKPQKFIASGQSAVFYDKKGQMLGGGIIR